MVSKDFYTAEPYIGDYVQGRSLGSRFPPKQELPRRADNKGCNNDKLCKKKNIQVERYPPPLTLHVSETTVENFSDPNIWGPAFWFTIHNGANHYPENASPIVAERMKGFLLGLPEMIPCRNCQVHARAHLEGSDLDEVCSGRASLFKFLVDFHNYVNKRYNKPVMAVEDAIALYSNGATIDVISYRSEGV